MAANNIKGITVTIGGDTTGLSKALQGVNKDASSLNYSLKNVNAALKLDPTNVTLLTQKQELLSKSVETTKQKLDKLREAKAQVENQYQSGNIERDAYIAFQKELVSTESKLKGLQKEQREFGTVTKQVMAEAGKSVQELGGKVSGAGKSMLPATVAITGLGAAAVGAFSEVDTGLDTIIKKTGASGVAAADLQKNYENLAASSNFDMSQIGNVIGEVNTRLKLTGSELESTSDVFLKFAEINDADVTTSIANGSKIMQAWNVDVKDTGSLLGLITNKSQETGIGVDTLMQSVLENNGIFKEMGLSLTQSINLLSSFESNGVNSSTALMGLRKACAAYTKDGLSMDEAIIKTIDSIKNAESETEALSTATTIFGTKGAAEMVNAISEGRLTLDDLSGSMQNYSETVTDTYASTQDGMDNLKVASNSAKIALGKVGNILSDVMGPILTDVAGIVKNAADSFAGLSDGQKKTILTIAGVVAAIAPLLMITGGVITSVGKMITKVDDIRKTLPIIAAGVKSLFGTLSANPIGVIIALISALVIGIIWLWNNCEEFRNGVTAIFSGIAAGFTAFCNFVVNLFTVTIPGAFSSLSAWLRNIFTIDWTNSFGIFGNILNAFFANIENIFNGVKRIFSGIVDFVAGVFSGDWSRAWQGIVNIFGGIFDTLISFAKAPLNGVIGLLNMGIGAINMLIRGLNNIGFDLPQWLGGGSFKINLPTIDSIPFLAQGGTLLNGSAIVGEKGAELLQVFGGQARVLPLSGNARNEGKGFGMGNISILIRKFINNTPEDGKKLVSRISADLEHEISRKERVFS